MSILSDLFERLRAVLFRERDEREMNEELHTHAAMEAEFQRRGGATEDDARRLGLIALGGVERVKEDVRDARGTRLLEDTFGDIAFTVRTLTQNPGFALVAILTLAVGIGGTTAVFSAVNAVLLQPLPYQQPGQLVRLYQASTKEPGDHGFVTPVHFVDIRKNMQSFESMAALMTYDETGADVGSGESVQRVRSLQISADYFDVVRVRPELGQGFRPEDETGAASVVVSHKLWTEQLHSDPSAIGKPLTMNGKPYTVLGVMPDGFNDPIAGAVDAWVPLDMRPGLDASNADNHYITVIARVRPTVPMARSQAELDALLLTLGKKYPDAKNASARIYPLKEDIVGSSSKALEIMFGAVGLVLLLVCVNIANLLLVRGSERAREFALRSALGAGRTRLVRQMLIESITLAIAGDIAGLAVARIAMSGIVILGQGTIPRLAMLKLDPVLLGFSLLIATLSAVVFGMAPALRAARVQPGDVLREETRSSTGGAGSIRLREWLVVSQVALAFVLMVGAGLLLSSFQRIRSIDLGIKPENVLTFELHLPTARYDSTARGLFYDRVASEIESVRGVRAAGGISKLPSTGAYNQWGTRIMSGPRTNDRDAQKAPQQRVIAGDYLRAVGIPLIKGRLFDAQDDPAAPRHVLINKRYADFAYPGIDPIGQRLKAGGREAEIIGVVGDVSINNEGGQDYYVYHWHRQFAGDRNWSLAQVVLLADQNPASQSEIRRTIAALDPQLVMYKPAMLDDVIGRGAAQRVFTLRILLAFAAVAIALAALGLFGVLSYGVKMRSREFGIRMALGAEQGAIRRMVMAKGLGVTGIGIGVGLLGALALSRVIASVLFKVSPLDPAVLGGSVAMMAAVAALAAYLPARRATRGDPRTVLQ